METFNLISGICSIIGLILSIFATSQVIKIKKQVNKNSVKTSKHVISKNTIGDNANITGGDFNEYYKK